MKRTAFALLVFAALVLTPAMARADTSTTAPACHATITSPLTVVNGKAVVSFTAPAGCTFGLASYEAPGAKFSAATVSQQRLFADQVNRVGGTVTLSVLVPDCFYQVDFFSGPVIVHFTGTSIYDSRLISTISGGAKVCQQPTTTTLHTTTTVHHEAPAVIAKPTTTTTEQVVAVKPAAKQLAHTGFMSGLLTVIATILLFAGLGLLTARYFHMRKGGIH